MQLKEIIEKANVRCVFTIKSNPTIQIQVSKEDLLNYCSETQNVFVIKIQKNLVSPNYNNSTGENYLVVKAEQITFAEVILFNK